MMNHIIIIKEILNKNVFYGIRFLKLQLMNIQQKQRKTSKVKKSIIGEQVAKLTKNVKVVLTRDSVFAAVSADQPKISHNHKMITRSKKVGFHRK